VKDKAHEEEKRVAEEEKTEGNEAQF